MKERNFVICLIKFGVLRSIRHVPWQLDEAFLSIRGAFSVFQPVLLLQLWLALVTL